MASPDLVVVIRGYTDLGKIPAEFLSFVQSLYPDSDVRCPDIDLSMFSDADCVEEADKIAALLSKIHDDTPGGLKNITIIGYSAGTLIARALVLRAHGKTILDRPAPSDAALPWAASIKHVVMMSGVLRGWTVSSATPKLLRFTHYFLRIPFAIASFWHGRKTFIESIERGRPIVIALRLAFLDLMKDGKAPHVSYLLGSRDEYISPADAIDMLPGPTVRFFQLPRTNHLQALFIGDDHEANVERKRIYRAVITQDYQSVAEYELDQSDIDDYREPLDRHIPQPVDKKIEHAVIVLHGIRDEGFWTKRIAWEIKKLGQPTVVRAPSPSYGYFSMWNFMNVWARRQKTYWLMEQYADVRTYFPQARVSFVGHSNGTYLAGKALELCPHIAFQRMYLAGSVMRPTYEWHRRSGQVEYVVNVRANKDFVVAGFPGFLEKLGLDVFLDVGGAGDTGFEKPAEPDRIRNIGPIEGSHSAGIAEPRWKEIARFIVRGDLPDPPVAPRAVRQIYAVRFGIVAIFFVLVALAHYVFSNAVGQLAGAIFLVPYAILLWLLWRIVRFF